MEISSHMLLASRDCKMPGCTEPSGGETGRYALLCDRHANAKRAGNLTGEPKHARSGGTHTGGYEKRTIRLTASARALDRAITAHKKTRAKLDEAVAEWEAAKRDLAAAKPIGGAD